MIESIAIDAIKTGILTTQSIIIALADTFIEHPSTNLIVYPDAVQALIGWILPLACLLISSLLEAAMLLDNESIGNVEEMVLTAERIAELGTGTVLVKGGNLPGEDDAEDVFSTAPLLWSSVVCASIRNIRTGPDA